MSKIKDYKKITYHEAISLLAKGKVHIENLPFRIVQEIQFNIENNKYKYRLLNRLRAAGFITRQPK